MRILKRLEGSRGFWFVIFISFLFFILRLPSLFEPLWYGDEGIYQAIGSSLNDGKLLYKEVFDNKPPLLYWTYSILQSDQFATRLISLFFGLFSVWIFFLLSRKLFQNNKNNIRYITTFIFAVLFGLPILEGNIANAENFMLLPIIASSFFIVSQKKYFIAGLLLGIAFLFKIVAIFDFLAFFIFCFFIYFDSLKQHAKKLYSLTAGFFIPLLIATFYFLLNGTFSDFVNAAFFTNIPYVNYGNRMAGIPSFLFIKFFILGIFTFYLFTKREKINKTSLFIIIWVAFSLFNALFTQRPYTHYLLVLLPSFSLLVGLVLFDKKYQRPILLAALGVLIIVVITFRVTNFKKNIAYYQNFISYITNGKTTTEYQAFFDRNTPYDYEIANFIKPKLSENDSIFVWGNNAQIYTLANTVAPTKYVVAYHISNYNDGVETTKNSIEKTKPKFIVEMKNVDPISFPLTNYSKKINIDNAIIYERVF